MGFLSRPSKSPARPPELRPPRSMWWWALPTALLIGVAAWGTTAWLLQDLDKLPVAEQVSARIEAVRTALAAAAGVGAGVTLLLAVRWQRHLELAAAHTAHDAAERRVTELYTKAAEQLGNDQAPVRLAGLYALERLAQDTPALRQTIVDVICAYLRMPYTPASGRTEAPESAVPRAAVAGISTPPAVPSVGRDPREERQVRLTAQRILAAHLRYTVSPPRSRWRPSRAQPNPLHWPGIRLDLTGATLIDLDLSCCRIGDAQFDGATFHGVARFDETAFTSAAWFSKANFTGAAWFAKTTFATIVWFNKAIFDSAARFDEVGFNGDVGCAKATFNADATFSGASFTGSTWFGETTFNRDAWFARAIFDGDAWFDETTFNRDAWFTKTTFNRDVMFQKATFNRSAVFEERRA
ncbi:pentapeptide repeat-containing protein [Nonomuraea sp. NPDC050691]|uniref:pentapeptide repeat-containing protein n=1 Tax=Nonomuraea sp. NPDC050691 TaxID=3155661 RepID=UPI0033DE857E